MTHKLPIFPVPFCEYYYLKKRNFWCFKATQICYLRTKFAKKGVFAVCIMILTLNFTVKKPYNFRHICNALEMWNDHLFWFIFNEITYCPMLVVIISESSLIYTFKKLPMKPQKDVKVKTFFKNYKSVQN